MAKKCGLSSEEIKFAKNFAKENIKDYNGDNYIDEFQKIVKGFISEEEVNKKIQLTYYSIIALMPQYLYEAYQELDIGFNEIDSKLIEGLQNLSKAINEGDNIVVDNINALLNDDLDGFSMGGISSGPEAPSANKVKKGLKEEFIDHLSTSPFQTVSQSNETTKDKDADGRSIIIVSQIPDPNESFYQNLIKSLSQIAFQSVLSTFENVTFQGHTGFKLRITTLGSLNEKHIKIKDETRSSGTLISIVTDNNGSILYFDDEYQINKKTGKPVYTRLSVVKKEQDEDAYKIRQRSYVRADGSTLPANPLISPRQLAKLDGIEDPTNAQIEEYKKIQQEQLRQLYFLQRKVREGKDFIVNITKASNGFIEINYKQPIDTNEINWEQSDIAFDPVIYNSKSYDPIGARWPGTAYINVPGMRRHAPFIAKNLSDESVNTILELIFNKELKLNGKPVRNTERVSILQDMLFMDYKKGVSVEIKDNRLFLFFGPEKARKKVDVEGLTDVSNIREKLEEFIKEKGSGEENTSKGKYFFPTNKNSVNVATINNNNITIKSVSINDFILNNSYTWLVPNENGDIIYSNAHFTYEFDIEQEEELSDVTKVKGETSEVQVWVPGVNVTQAKEAARKSNPKESGIYSMRPATGNIFTYKGVTVNAEMNFGNPWTGNPNLLKFHPELILAEGATQEERLENAVANYENWIKKLDFLDVFPERRDFIREKIKEGYFDGERIIYFKTGYRSHADVIAEMVTDKTKLDGEAPTAEPEAGEVETYKGLKVINSLDITNEEGQKGAAQYDRVNNLIKVNRKLLTTKFEEKAWTNMRKLIETIDGEQVKSKAENLPANSFNTYKEFEMFVIEHEYQHSLYSRKDFNKEFPDGTKGEYETAINNRALDSLAQQTSEVEDLQQLEEGAIAVIKSKKGDDKYIYLKGTIDTNTLDKDDKGGKRVKGSKYNPSGKKGEGIEIVGDYYSHKTINDATGKDKADIIIVDSIEDAQKQYDSYLDGGAKQFTSIELKPTLPTEPTKKKDEIDDTGNLEFPDDLFESAKKDIRTKLKRLGKNRKLEATRKWYVESGLNDLVPFEIAWGIVNSDAYATFTRYGVTLWAGSDYSDLYHEGWHVFSSFVLTPEEQDQLYNEFTSLEGTFTNYQGVVKRFADASKLDAEEFYAREFREYALEFGKFDEISEIVGDKVLGKRIVKNKFFRKIYQFLNWLFSGFKRISAGQRRSLIETMDAMELFHNKQVGVKKMYDRLRTLNLKNEIPIDIASVKLRKGFDRLNSNRIKSFNENSQDEFSLQESVVVKNSMEAWFSDFITGVAKATDKEGNKKLNPNISIVGRYFSDPGKYLKFFYDQYLPNKLIRLRNEYIKAGNNESVNLIDKIRRNYSDYESSLKANTDDLFNGIIRFHLDNSIFVKDIDKKILDRAIYVDDYDALVTFDKSGFEISALDLADLEVTWLISSLHKYDGADPVKNMLGVHELNDFSRTFATLISKLTGIEDRVEMEKELKKLEGDYPMFGELLAKMGNSRSLDPSTWSLWTSFKLAFYLMNVPVFQLNLMETYEDDSNNVSHTVTYGRSSASYRVVEMDFRSGFTTATLDDNEYIISTEEGNQLDIQKILNDFPVSRLRSLAGKRAFLKAIGLPLTDNIEINTQLNSDRIKFEFLRGKLKAIAEADRIVRDITRDLRISFEVLPNSKVISPSEATNVSTILEIEYKYSGKYKSGSVTTAVGTRTYEQGQHSSLSIQIDSLNKATSFDQMMEEMPWMRHLNPLKNPDTRRSITLNSLFEMDNFEKGRPKRKDAALFLRNLSGIQSVVDDKADYDFSVAAADSVRYDKMILDIYALLLGGAPATMTHSDKGMVYSMGVNKVVVQGLPSQKNSSLYVDTSDFFNIYDEDADSDGYVRAYSIYINQLRSELEIMKLVRKGEAGVNVPGYTIKDSKGERRGADYQLFQDILKDPLKKRLITEYMKTDDLEVVISDNKENIESDLKEYFDKHIEDTYNYIEELLFVSKELESSIKKELKEKKISTKDIANINPEQFKKAIISSYFINYEIHNIESIRLVYGNVAQYNMAKEEKHKRNANVASTGRAFSLDQVSIDYVNTLSRRYRSSLSEIYGASWNRRVFNGTFNSVVFEDYVFPQSLLYDHYFDALVDNYVKTRGLSVDEAKKKTTIILKPYKDMEVGDGQGWITFDAYRIARKLTSRWGPAQEKMYNDIIDGKVDDLAKVASFFPPLKYLMNGPLQAEGIPVIGQHKFSLMPLIPNLLENKNFEQLHIELEKNNADYALFKSGSKVSTITDESGKADQLYNINTLENGREILEVIKDSKYVINTVYLQYMKDVLDVSMKYKYSSVFSTQMRKLVEQGFVVNGVPIDYQIGNENRILNWDKLKVKGEQAMFDASPVYKKYKTYENLISDLIRVRKQDLLKEAGWTENELNSGTGNLESLISMIKNQLSIIADLSENELDFIGVKLTNELKNDLSYSLVSDKLESMLISIANKSLIKQLVNGESLVQTSSALSEWTNATKQQLNEYGNDLETYKRVKLKDGSWSETYEMEVKVSLQGNFKKLFNLTHTDGKKVSVRNKQGDIDQKESLKRLNELINNKKWRAKKENRKMITMVGVRIPVQGANSMEMMIIREFLPEKTGNIIIPPKEIVAKSGSDFDIDKLTIMMPGIVNTLKGPRIVSSKMKTRKESTLLTKKAMFETELEEIRNKYRDIRSKRDISKEYKWSAEKQSRYVEILQQISALERKWYELNNEKTFYSNKLTEISKWGVKNNEVVDTRSRGEYYKVYNLYIESEAAFLNVASDLADLEAYKMEFIKENNQEIKDSIDIKQEAEMDKVKQKLDKVKIELYAKSSEAIETDILFAVKDLIADPVNFVNLVTPNSTEQFTEIQEGEEKSHLERLREKSSYSPKRGTRGMLDKVSHTRIIEPIYNIEKHAANAVGKATLGIGAVDNTFNALLTRAGAYLNKKYVHGSVTRRVAILMDHNVMPYTEDQVSLSDLYDYDRVNLISDTISQLINGWVDVAKEAWIFDINGNKILSPVLLLLIQSGVPIKQALNFIANPYVKAYVEEIYKTSSIFSRTNTDIGPIMFHKEYILGNEVLRRDGVDRRQIKRIAKSRMFYKMGLEGYASADAMKLISFNTIYDNILKGYDRKFSEEDLDQIVDQKATPINEASVNTIRQNKAAMAFFHYLELDDIASNFTNLKGTLNFDTKRSTSLIDYAIRQSEVDEFMESAKNIISSPIRTNNESNVNIEIVGDTALTDLKILEKNIKESDITFFVRFKKQTREMTGLIAKAKKMKKAVLAISLENPINPSAILDKINNLNLNRPVKINIIGDSERSLEKSVNPFLTDIESIKSFSKEFIKAIKGASIDFVLSTGESGFEQFINIEAADQSVNSKIVSNYKFTTIAKDKVVTIREQSDFRLRFKNFTTDYNYDTGMTGNIFPMSIIASIIEDSPIADFDISKFQLSMWSKMFELKSNETLNRQIISWVKDPNVKAQMKALYGEPEIYLQKFRNSIVASALIDSIKEVKYSEVDEYKSIRAVATPIDTADLPSKGLVIYRDEMQNLQMLIDRDFIKAEYSSKRFVNESVDLTVNTFNNVDEYFHFVMERELIRAQLPASKMKGLTLFTKLYEQNKTETEKDIKAAKRAYEQIITNMALYNIFNFYTLFQNPNFSYAKEIMRIKKEHPKLNNLDVVNNLNINASFKKKSKNKVKNLKFADARFTKDEVDTYFENMEVLMNASDLKRTVFGKEDVSDNEIEYISTLFKVMPLFSIMQSGFNSKDVLSINRPMPSDSIIYLFNKYKESIKNKMENVDYIWRFKDNFDAHSNNRTIRNRFIPALNYNVVTPLIPSDYLGSLSEKIKVYKGSSIEFVNYAEANPSTKFLIESSLFPNGALKLNRKSVKTPENVYVIDPKSIREPSLKHYLSYDALNELSSEELVIFDMEYGTKLNEEDSSIRNENLKDTFGYIYTKDVPGAPLTTQMLDKLTKERNFEVEALNVTITEEIDQVLENIINSCKT